MQQTTTIQMSRGRHGMVAISTISLVVALVALWAVGHQDLPTTSAPEATRAQTMPFTSPRFADEAAYVPTVQEYLNPALGEEYLPVPGVIAAPRSTPPISARILSEELASSTHSLQAIVAEFGEAADHSPAAGPR